ncbi:MAG: hypothetical protein N2D54_10340, partial [Chloroflexota bacterium]
MKIEFTAPQDWQDKLTLTPVFAVGETAPGSPGKTPGEVQLTAQHAGIISLGMPDSLNEETLRRAGGELAKWLRKFNVGQVGIFVDIFLDGQIQESLKALTEGLLLGDFDFTTHKSKAKPKPALTLHYLTADDSRLLAEEVRQAEIIAKAVNLSRTLGHEPPNVLNPVTLAARCEDIAEASGMACIVLDDFELAEMGAGAIVSVGKSSPTPSRLIILEYSGRGKGIGQPPLVLVGKAITFDTGGYSIKTKLGMVGQKYDLNGGAAVIGTMQALAALKLQSPVIGVIPAAENMISSKAYRPNDIITSLSGKTIEIISADAEGRMVMADAFTYAQRTYSPRFLIDIATLTGGVVTALGR